MRRLLLVVVLFTVLGGVFAPSTPGDPPKQRILERRVTFGPFQAGTLVVTCPPGYEAVSAAILEVRGPLLVYSGLNEGPARKSRRVIRAKNLGQQQAALRVEVRCVKVVMILLHSYVNISTGMSTVPVGVLKRYSVRCPPSHSPLGWGYRQSAQGGSPNDPPPVAAANRLVKVQPVRNGFNFAVEGVGVNASDVEFQADCIDRHQRTRNIEVEYRVIRRHFNFSFGARTGGNRNLHCGSGSTPAGPGWSLPNEGSIFAGPTDLLRRGTRLGFSNRTDSRQSVEGSQLCLEQKVSRR